MQTEELKKQEQIRQMQMDKMQNEQAMQRKYENQRHMNKPYDVAILLAAINGIKKSNDYILNLKDFKYQIDAINNQLGVLKNKGVTSIDGMLFLKARKPKTNQSKPGSFFGGFKGAERVVIKKEEKLKLLGWVRNPCVRELLADNLYYQDQVVELTKVTQKIAAQNWDEANGFKGQVSNIAHALYKINQKLFLKIQNQLRSFQDNPNCPEVTPIRNIRNLQIQNNIRTAFSNYDGKLGMAIDSVYAMEEAPIKYDIHEDFVDYVFSEAEKEQQRRQVPTPQINTNNEAKLEKIIAEKEALEKKLIDQSVTPPSKINTKYIYAGLGVVAFFGLIWMFKGKKTTKVII